MTSIREDAAESLQQAADAMAELRAQLLATERAYLETKRHLEKGIPVSVTLESVTAGPTRQSLNDRLEAAERARHQARLAVIAAGLDEGMSVADVGRIMRFSRQLAARYAKEARARWAGSPANGSRPKRLEA